MKKPIPQEELEQLVKGILILALLRELVRNDNEKVNDDKGNAEGTPDRPLYKWH